MCLSLTQQSHIRYTLFYTLIKSFPMTYTWTLITFPKELPVILRSSHWPRDQQSLTFCRVWDFFVLFWRVLFLSCYVLILWSGDCFVFLLGRDFFFFWLFAECGEYCSICMKQKVCILVTQSCLTLSDPMDCRAPLSFGFSRQQYWSGLPFPSPGIEPTSPT